LNLNKPPGMSSRGAVDIVARAAGTGRVGHAGTLDPLASGVLIVCIGWATRLVSYVQQLRKRYRAEFRLGCVSDTDDATGEIREMPEANPPTPTAIEAALAPFVGRIRQIPPSHSAVHVGGRRAYHLARRGEAVELAPREVEVHRLELTDYAYPRLELDIECGSGTYVRSIGRDLGQALGCGALMTALERLAIGDFRIENAVDPAALTSSNLESFLLPPLAAVAHLPQHRCTEAEFAEIRHGRSFPAVRTDRRPGEFMAIVAPDGALAALGEYDGTLDVIRPRQVFTAA
jgi:tRNA pseudouridine55 synthase